MAILHPLPVSSCPSVGSYQPPKKEDNQTCQPPKDSMITTREQETEDGGARWTAPASCGQRAARGGQVHGHPAPIFGRHIKENTGGGVTCKSRETRRTSKVRKDAGFCLGGKTTEKRSN